MKRFKIYHSKRFDRELAKYDKSFQDRIDKIENEIVINPYTGSPLNVKWFREKRYEKYRVYFIIYEDLQSVIMVGISKENFEKIKKSKFSKKNFDKISFGNANNLKFSEKKNQQKIINTIKLLFDFFKKELEKLIKEDIT